MHDILNRFVAALVAVLLVGSAHAADSLATMPPLGIGPYPVACSNVVQDFTRLAPGDDVQTYWEGVPRNGSARYITDLLADPAHTLGFDLAVPDDRTVFGDYATRSIPYTVLVCYPTRADNPRPDYLLPNGRAVPHMQQGGAAPIFPDEASRYPVLLFSVGLGGSPLSNDYIAALEVFASYGYVVVAPFPGDARIADIRLEDFNDVLFAILNFNTFVAMQSLRPLTLEVALNLVLAHPDYAAHVDPDRIGAFGASLGAESALLLTGARLTTTVGQSSQTVITDPRIRAVASYVPYFGQSFYPAFGRNQAGLAGITVPVLAIAGTADTTAPIAATEEGMRQLGGSRILVALNGVEHGFDTIATQDIFTWSLVFLAAHVQDDRLARARLARMQRVGGGVDDGTRLDYTAPAPASGWERIVTEFYRPAKDHFFITADPAETAMLAAGNVLPGWMSTGFAFKAWAAGAPYGIATCRFFGTPGIGPDSHFYTNDPGECAVVRANPAWTYEGIAFNAFPVVGGDCPPDRIPVIRLYNNGKGGEANHRYTTSRSEIESTVANGWSVEGPVFCAVP
ncbi:MAG: hypothetical protein ABI920_09400 [Casimicrobiaceae bacterium]